MEVRLSVCWKERRIGIGARDVTYVRGGVMVCQSMGMLTI